MTTLNRTYLGSRGCRLILMGILLTMSVPLPAAVKVDGTIITHGDMNGDSVFDLLDLLQLERAVAVDLKLPDKEIAACDVDGDGELTTYDLLVMSQAYKHTEQGENLFDAIKGTIETDLGKEGDNVNIYLDLARFYAKENRLDRSRQVLESIIEVLDIRHPLYETINQTLNDVESKAAAARMVEDDSLQQPIYDPSEDPSGKMSLRQKVIEMKNKLADLMKDQKFSANYDSKRTRGKLDALMDNMLRKIGKDQMVEPGEITSFNADIRSALEDPDNLVKSLSPEQQNEIVKIVDQTTSSMRNTAMDMRQKVSAAGSESGGDSRDNDLIRQQILDRSQWTPESPNDNMRMDRLIVAGVPSISPDTISIVAPDYMLKWDVSNVLGAKEAALEISKSNRKFTVPRSVRPDQENTLYYTPALGGVTGQRRGSALELEGVGVYQYRVAAIDSRGELISRFSDAIELTVVYNNVNIAANQPTVTPDTLYPESPVYTFKWDVTNLDGARDAAVEVSNPNAEFSNPNGRERDRSNTFFFNPALGKVNGTFASNVDGLAGVGRYLFRVIAVSPYGDFVGRWSSPDTLHVTTAEELARAVEQNTTQSLAPTPEVSLQDTTVTVTWDVSAVGSARGIALEISPADSVAPAGEKSLFSRRIDRPAGNTQFGLGQFPERGQYSFRVAAVDSSGLRLTLWSKPATWSHPGQFTADRTNPVSTDSTPPAPALVNPPPEGKELQVTTPNTPLYENKSLSSRELMSLKQGDLLVLVLKDDIWYRVYVPQRGAYGWVLSFNVLAPEGI